MPDRTVRKAAYIPAVHPRRPHPAAGTPGPLRSRPGPHDHQLAIQHYVFDPNTIDPVKPQALKEDVTHGRS
ncbi:hypothetical protein [Streptomyces sp. NPDC051572]|uniref:hypothetical protein n=1 Tax=Streptomyces sp. NPDC051572 TaxID=3155802 RepID=UPI00344F2E88